MGLFGFGKKKDEVQEPAKSGAPDAAPAAAPEEKSGVFSRFWKGLTKTRTHVSGQVDDLIESTEKIDEDFYESLIDILIMSDMGVKTSEKVIAELKRRVEAERITDARQARRTLKTILKEIMAKPREPLSWPMVMLVVGVNGVGKTTTIGKLALRFKNARHSVVLAAADTFRAAAADQLTIWAERAGADIVRHGEGADPAAVVFDSIAAAKARGCDIIIVDTAGRLHNKTNLMNELNKIDRVISRELPDSSRETLLVLDATTGQNAVSQAEQFNKAAKLTGIVLTKLDGTAKGGIVVAISAGLGVPVKYVGVGEGIDDLMPFERRAFVEALLPEEGGF